MEFSHSKQFLLISENSILKYAHVQFAKWIFFPNKKNKIFVSLSSFSLFLSKGFAILTNITGKGHFVEYHFVNITSSNITSSNITLSNINLSNINSSNITLSNITLSKTTKKLIANLLGHHFDESLFY